MSRPLPKGGVWCLALLRWWLMGLRRLTVSLLISDMLCRISSMSRARAVLPLEGRVCRKKHLQGAGRSSGGCRVRPFTSPESQ